MNKKIFLIFIFIFLIIGLASAELQFDNVKKYNEETRTVTIENLFGLGKTYADIQLITPLKVKLSPGYQKVAIFETRGYVDYKDFINEINFYDIKKDMLKVNKNFDLKYLSYEEVLVNDFEEIIVGYSGNGTAIYENQIVGSHYEEKEIWTKLTPADMKKNENITIGIFTEVKLGDKIEWIPNFMGVQVEEWASWESSLDVGLKNYYKLDELSGIIIDQLGNQNGTNNGATYGVTGIVNTALDFESGDSDWVNLGSYDPFTTNNFTISFWIKPETIANNMWFISKRDGATAADSRWGILYDSTNGVSYQGSATSTINSGQFVSNGDWQNIILVSRSTGTELFYNGTSVYNGTSLTLGTDTTASYEIASVQSGLGNYDGVTDEVAVWNRSLTYHEVYLMSLAPEYGVIIGGLQVTLNSPINYYNSSIKTIGFNATVIDNLKVKNVSLLIDGVINETNSSEYNGTYLFTKNLSEGLHNWSILAYDNDTNNESSATRFITIDTTNPIINITSPVSSYESLSVGEAIDLNFTVNDSNLDSCWYNYNFTNTTVSCLNGVQFSGSFNYSRNYNNLTVYANDTSGNSNSQTINWNVNFIGLNQTYDSVVYETDLTTFQVFYEVANTTINVNGFLNYNGTRYTSTSSCNGQICNSITSINVPSINSSQENVTFYWEIIVFDPSSSVTKFLTNQTQTINEIKFEECGAITNKTLVFTSFDESDLSNITNWNFDGNFEYWLGTGSIRDQYNLTKNNTNTVEICLEPTGSNFYIDAIIEYDEYNSTDYTRRNYYFLNDSVSNQTQYIELGLLKASESTSFIEKVQDRNLLSVEGALVITERYYPGLNDFKIVQIGKTDKVGQTIGFFKTETVDYRFKIKQESGIVLTTETQKVIPTSAPFTLTFTIGENIDVAWREFEELPNFTSSPIQTDRDTKIITWTYIDDSEDFQQAQMKIWLINDTDDEILICNSIGNESSQTLTCNLSSYTSGRFNIGAFLTRAGITYIIEQTTFSLDSIDIEENYGLFLGLLILIICAFAFKYNEIAGIILLNVGAIVVNLIGWINFGWTSIFGFIAVSIIIIAVLER